MVTDTQSNQYWSNCHPALLSKNQRFNTDPGSTGVAAPRGNLVHPSPQAEAFRGSVRCSLLTVASPFLGRGSLNFSRSIKENSATYVRLASIPNTWGGKGDKDYTRNSGVYSHISYLPLDPFYAKKSIYFIRIILNITCVCSCASCASCLTLCDPMDWSPPGSSVHGISQARILERLPFPFPGIEPMSLESPALSRHVLCHWCHLGSPILYISLS